MNFQISTLRYADRAKELTKPALPQNLLEKSRKRRLANIYIPETPANWKRPPLSVGSVVKMNNTIETPTPTKRLKVLAGSRVDTGHSQSLTFATPNETPSVFKSASSNKNIAQRRDFLASAVKRNMDKILQNIEEESSEIISSELNCMSDKTLQPNASPGFESEVRGSPYLPECNTAIAQRKKMKDNDLNSTSNVPSSNIKSLNTTSLNNATLIDVTNLSPMIRRITDQVGKQFEQRFR